MRVIHTILSVMLLLSISLLSAAGSIAHKTGPIDATISATNIYHCCNEADIACPATTDDCMAMAGCTANCMNVSALLLDDFGFSSISADEVPPLRIAVPHGTAPDTSSPPPRL